MIGPVSNVCFLTCWWWIPQLKTGNSTKKRGKKPSYFFVFIRIGVTLERTLIYYIFLTALWSFCGSPRVQTCWPTLRLILLEHWLAQRKCQRVFSWLLGGIQALSINHSYNNLNGFQLLMGARSRKASSDTGNDSKRLERECLDCEREYCGANVIGDETQKTWRAEGRNEG